MARNYNYQPRIHKNSLKLPVNSTVEYVENKMIKTYDFLYSFPSGLYTHISTGQQYTQEQLDTIYPTNKDLQMKQNVNGDKNWML